MRTIETLFFSAALLIGLSMLAVVAEAGSNPCNPCAANPCSMKKHMNPCNPCSMKKNTNPRSANPCSMKSSNPCAASANVPIRPHAYDDFWQAVAVGRKMWNDEGLGTAGVACMSCHADHELLNLGKNQNFPHYVKMVGDVVTLDQMINYCMINPMKGKQFEKNSKELTAMAAYYRSYRMQYMKENRK